MRCSDCESEPLNPARYCECCGRELVLLDNGTHQVDGHAEKTSALSAHAVETDPIDDANDWAPTPSALSVLRCPTCGGPSFDGGPCQACHEPSPAPSPIEDPNSAPPAASEATASAKTQPVEDAVSSAAATSIASSQDCSDRTASANAETPLTLPEPATTPARDQGAAASGPTLETETVTSPEVLPKRAKAVAVQTENARRPVLVPKRPSVPATPERRHPSIALVATGVVVAAIGAGVFGLRLHEKSVMARAEQQATIVAVDGATEVADAEDRTLPSDHPPAPIAASQDRNPASARERSVVSTTASESPKPTTPTSREGSAPSRPKPVTSARPSRLGAAPVADKSVRAQGSVREVPVVSVIKSAPVVAAPAVEVAATAPTYAPPPSAVGPFFEIRDVNESPRIEKRAEPRLPAELKSRSVKEVVVVRALVSQSGHPSRISLLRRSKSGPQVDDVILSSVNEWTFSPARKKGEAVSCWFNFAVQLGGPD